jgi:hypothetical protein
MKPSTALQLVIGWMVVTLHAAAAESAATARAIDVTGATVVVPPGMSGPEKKAVQMLIEEAEKRSQVRWPVNERSAEAGPAVVFLGQREALVRSYPALAAALPAGGNRLPEGYQITSDASGRVIVAGNDARGVLFGAGRLLRLLDYSPGRLTLASGRESGHRATLSAARPSARVPAEDKFLRRLGRRAVGAVHSRSDCVRRECNRGNPAALG